MVPQQARISSVPFPIRPEPAGYSSQEKLAHQFLRIMCSSTGESDADRRSHFGLGLSTVVVPTHDTRTAIRLHLSGQICSNLTPQRSVCHDALFAWEEGEGKKFIGLQQNVHLHFPPCRSLQHKLPLLTAKKSPRGRSLPSRADKPSYSPSTRSLLRMIFMTGQSSPLRRAYHRTPTCLISSRVHHERAEIFAGRTLSSLYTWS